MTKSIYLRLESFTGVRVWALAAFGRFEKKMTDKTRGLAHTQGNSSSSQLQRITKDKQNHKHKYND